MANVEAKLKIDIGDLKQLTNIQCKNTKCINNLRPFGVLGCNLKYIQITDEGKCYCYKEE